ncbi:heat repeat protein [Niveomyces insectorum RCEF 264]|uniref:Heat repeat protein n=1 Tax=Niveomyces insectorum RCEF 264 TaxID=1081102 RepID=A0A162MS29_9HYPO|nr:heat repeat protein [Niveomyces insectorum RCEF 264]
MSTAVSPAADGFRGSSSSSSSSNRNNGGGDDDAAAVAAAAASAAAATVAVNAAPASTSPNPELDTTHLSNLPPEQQELTLLQFSAKLGRHVRGLGPDDCTAQQFYLKKEVFKILNLTTPYPSRVVRNTLGRCLAHVLSTGDRKLLFETIHDLNTVLASGGGKVKTDGSSGDHRTKLAAVVCLGDVFGAAGDSAISLHQLTCATLLRLLKAAQHHAGLRAAVFAAFAKMITCIGTSTDEGIARDLWKQARNHASNDKGALVAVAACRCLTALVRCTTYVDSASDFDSLSKTIFKTIDAPSPHVRRAAADCLVEAVVKGYAESVGANGGGGGSSNAVGGGGGGGSGSGGTGGGGEGLGRVLSSRRPARSKGKRTSVHPGVNNLQDDDDLPGSRSSSPGPPPKHGHNRLSLPLADVLKMLSTHYVRSSTTNRARAALGICYGRVLQRLGEKAVEQNYFRIIENLTVDLLGHATISNNRYRLLVSRRIVDTIMQDIVGSRILSEAGQVAAAKTLVNDVLKNYPQVVKERPEPSKHTLVAALGALSSLIGALGSAANNFADACRDGLLQLLPHPTYSVHVHAAACLKSFVLACPQQLLPCLSICMNSLGRELSQLGTGTSASTYQHRRCLGFAYGLAATLSASPLRPLYGSVDINSRVLTMATNLLKTSGKLELRVASVQIQVAWILIGGLMSLGPNFVKIHLSQMLLLWKNALPKPLAKDNVASRNYLETSFLTHVRDCALGSILAFLQFNSRLLTVDVSKRIAAMLQHTTSFLKTLPAKKTTDDISQRLTPALQLHDLDIMVQRRVLQCYLRLINLAPAGSTESLLQSNLLTLVISLFADPDNYGAGSLSASIATAAGTFETIWDVADNAGFGVTGLVSGFKVRGLPSQHETNATEEEQQQLMLSALDETAGPEGVIESLLLSPVCGAYEHDASLLYVANTAGRSDDGVANEDDDTTGATDGGFSSLPDPPATEVVNLAIQLFAYVFPLTPPKVQESILEQMATFMSAGSLQRDPGRKAAINVNVAVALLSTLKVAVRETQASAGNVTNQAVERLLQDMVRGFVIDPDQYVRSIGYAAVGRLCSACGNAFTNHEIKYLVDTIVINREPSARAGCAMALGCIQTKVGGMAAGYHLKTILGILMSLCNDPHPTVHFWALEAFARASDAAGLNFSSYVSSTLGMLAQLYGSENHHAEVASAVSMNLELDLSTTAAIARCVDALINVLGPDLQETTKSRELIFTLVRQFEDEDDLQVQRASLGCLEHLSLYAPGYVDFRDYVKLLQRYLQSDHQALRDAAVDGLYNLMKRNADEVVAAADPGLEDQLWLVLDRHPAHDGIRNILRNWMRQGCLQDTAAWLQRFQRVLKMTRPKVPETTRLAAAFRTTHGGGGAAIDLQDEEVAGLGSGDRDDKLEKDEDGPVGGGPADGRSTMGGGAATSGNGVSETAVAAAAATAAAAAAGGLSTTSAVAAATAAAASSASSGSEVEPLRWQITAFVLSLLNEVFLLVGKDAAATASVGGDVPPAQAALQNKIADVVRMAFSASTSSVLEQRIWGLKIIGALLRMFGKTPDPDFEEAMILEQYQAQISSALTPAFAADSSPELASEAVHVCAAFVATGIVTDVDRMGRILKTLIGALANFTSDDQHERAASIGELKGLSANAQVMVKMAVFAAWAELQVASLEQQYLVDVLRPHIGQLTPLWLESLREFARLRFEPDISMTLGPPSLSGSLDTIYAALNRETLLAFYQDAWLKLVDAIASLIEQDSEFVFDALDGKLVEGREYSNDGPNRNEANNDKRSEKAVATPAQARQNRNADINYRDEPVAFFFVLFGIAFEALAARQGHADSLATPGQTLEILLALKKILHPSVSGQAIYRDAIFSETMDLLDRLVLTEGLAVQGVIVEIARALCLAHPAARTREQPETGELSDDIEQLFELTRIIVLVLAGLLPALSSDAAAGGSGSSSQPSSQLVQQQQSTAPRYHMTEEAVLLLVHTALGALVDAAEVFPAIIRTDLHACLVHIFATILATPACQEVVVPQSLPTLKRFIATARGASSDDETGHSNAQTDAQMRSCLRRFLSIYLHAQKREAPTSLASVKNCLLAITILFTAGHNNLSANDPLVAKFLDELLDCLTDRMTAKIAANCCRSLLLQLNTRSTAADQSIGRYLLPRLLTFATDVAPPDPERARGLVSQTLCAFVGVKAAAATTAAASGASEERQNKARAAVTVAMALVLPALLSRASGELAKVWQGGDTDDDDGNGKDEDDDEENGDGHVSDVDRATAIYKETSGRLLELASADATAFRSVVGGLNETQRAFMEEVIQAGRQAEAAAKAVASSNGQPSIALKMNFGGV